MNIQLNKRYVTLSLRQYYVHFHNMGSNVFANKGINVIRKCAFMRTFKRAVCRKTLIYCEKENSFWM